MKHYLARCSTFHIPYLVLRDAQIFGQELRGQPVDSRQLCRAVSVLSCAVALDMDCALL